MVALIAGGTTLAYHPIYIFASIAFGSLFVPWMNDSGFWVVALKNFSATVASIALIVPGGSDDIIGRITNGIDK